MNDFNIKKFLTENKMTRNSRLLSENVSREEEIKKIIDDKVRQWRMDAGAQSVMIDDMPEEAMDAVMKKFRDEAESELGLNEELNSEESTYQFSEYDFDIKKNPEFYSKVVEIVKNNSDMTDEEIDAKIEAATDYHYSEARKANKNSREYPSMTAEEFAQSVMS